MGCREGLRVELIRHASHVGQLAVGPGIANGPGGEPPGEPLLVDGVWHPLVGPAGAAAFVALNCPTSEVTGVAAIVGLCVPVMVTRSEEP